MYPIDVPHFEKFCTSHVPYWELFVPHFGPYEMATLREVYSALISNRFVRRACHENRLVRSIRHQLKNSTTILRKTDKSKVFYLGHADDYHRKAMEYMNKTAAYQEITTGINPCNDHVQVVLSLIDPLLNKGAINLKIWRANMRPSINQIELAHLYFNPKPHKVSDRRQASYKVICLMMNRLEHH